MKTRLLLPAIVSLMFLSPRGLAEEGIRHTPLAIVAGEVENPGHFDLSKAATLGAIFTRITKPLAMGNTGRIRLYRNGTLRDYDVKKSGDVAVIDGDVLEVPTKSVYEGQSEAQDRVVTEACEDPKAFLEKAALLKSDLWEVQTNWRDGLEGIEFRPIGKLGEGGGIWVFVRIAGEAAMVDRETLPPKSAKAVVVISRDYGRGAESHVPSGFETALMKLIRKGLDERRADPNQSEQSPSAGDDGNTKPATPATLTAEAREALELGRKVLAVRQAIANPQTPGAMESVTALGLDSRYYAMVRGWLTQQLAGDQSILDASGENTPKAVKDRIAFLHKAIRAIDLE